MSETTTTTMYRGCGLNPFCHIGKAIAWIFILAIVGIVIHALFFRAFFSKSYVQAEWQGVIKKTQKKEKYKCCEDYQCSGKLDPGSHLDETRRCCITTSFGNTTRETCKNVNCVNWMDPCVNCDLSRTYKAYDQTADYSVTIPRKYCSNVNAESIIPKKLYVHPDDIHKTSITSTGEQRTKLGLIIFIYWIIVGITIAIYKLTYKVAKNIF